MNARMGTLLLPLFPNLMAAIQTEMTTGTDQRYHAVYCKIGISMLSLQRYSVAKKCTFGLIYG